jgi:hypothetical protein
MFPFWDIVIAPIIEAIAPDRLVEIGALHGDTTQRLRTSLGSTSELHVIDPEPQFDPAEHERQFPGRYVFHRDLSLNVLTDLAPVDVALIDGDHNWYTVYNELRLLTAQAENHDKPPPIFFLHDVAWPYGRRDGYYAPEQIPDAYRQPCARLGMARDNPELLPEGGMNQHVWNAIREGGAKNGVLTALEDFISDDRAPARCVVLDAYAGLAIAAFETSLARYPDAAPLIDELAAPDGSARVRAAADEVVRSWAASQRH